MDDFTLLFFADCGGGKIKKKLHNCLIIDIHCKYN